MTPAPKHGDVTFEFVDPDTHAVDRSVTDDVDATGLAIVETPWPGVGTWELRATFDGITYTSSTATKTIEIPALDTTTSLVASPPTSFPGHQVELTATVSSDPTELTAHATGTVAFAEDVSGVTYALGSAPLTNGVAVLAVSSGFKVGDHKIVAQYAGDSERKPSNSDAATVSVDAAGSFVQLIGPDAIETGQPVSFTTPVGASVDTFWEGATVKVAATGTGYSCVASVTSANDTSCTIPTLPVGSYSFIATYSGNADTLGSVSDPVPLVVTPNLVHVSSVGLSTAHLYPAKDGYRGHPSYLRQPPGATQRRDPHLRSDRSPRQVERPRAGSRKLRLGLDRSNVSRNDPRGRDVQSATSVTDAAGLTRVFTSSVYLSHKRARVPHDLCHEEGQLTLRSWSRQRGQGDCVDVQRYARLSSPKAVGRVGYQFDTANGHGLQVHVIPALRQGRDMDRTERDQMQNFAACPYKSTGSSGFLMLQSKQCPWPQLIGPRVELDFRQRHVEPVGPPCSRRSLGVPRHVHDLQGPHQGHVRGSSLTSRLSSTASRASYNSA